MGQAQLTVRVDYQLDNGIEGRVQPVDAFSVAVTGTNLHHVTQRVKIAEDALDLGNVPAGGLLRLTCRGIEGTYVDVLAESGGAPVLRLLPGVPHLTQLTPNAVPYVTASVDNVDIEIEMLEA